MSDDRLLQILQSLAVLLFVSVGALALGRARTVWVRWARWGAVAVFSITFLYAVMMTVRWALGEGHSLSIPMVKDPWTELNPPK